MSTAQLDRRQTGGEEIANTVSHGLGAALAMTALPLLVWRAAGLGTATDVVAASVFAGSMVLLYGISALYHALPHGRAKVWLNRLKHPLVSTGLYLAMGWVAVVAAAPLVARMPVAGLVWLVAGGLSYTLGAVVFLLDNRIRYAHFVWHLFVLGGSVCHFFAAFWYAYG